MSAWSRLATTAPSGIRSRSRSCRSERPVDLGAEPEDPDNAAQDPDARLDDDDVRVDNPGQPRQAARGPRGPESTRGPARSFRGPRARANSRSAAPIPEPIRDKVVLRVPALTISTLLVRAMPKAATHSGWRRSKNRGCSAWRCIAPSAESSFPAAPRDESQPEEYEDRHGEPGLPLAQVDDALYRRPPRPLGGGTEYGSVDAAS